jgi:hypothetical protein
MKCGNFLTTWDLFWKRTLVHKVGCMNIVWYICSVNTTMGRDQDCICHELVRENASDVKVSLFIFVMSWVSERTKILINKRCNPWCTCVMKNDDLSVLCTHRPWFIKVSLLVIIIIRTSFIPQKKGRCWCLPLNILLTGQTLGWEVTEIGCTHETHHTLDTFCWI